MKVKPSQEILDYLKLIDDKYFEAKRNKWSRFSVEWGKWSREMNIQLNEKAKKGGFYRPLYDYLFIYWVLKSRILQLHVERPFLKEVKKRKEQKMADDVKKIIKTGDVPTGKMIVPQEIAVDMALVAKKLDEEEGGGENEVDNN